ncbi:MAG: DUF4189 domain-containing protein [Rhodospirillaceae bacterium]|nr:DUF4189 domain-containing protein [Rhodospirillaceae bacterium]
MNWNAMRVVTIAAALSAFAGIHLAQAAGPYGALAADGKGRFGYAVNYPSEAAARDAALKDCASTGCKIVAAGEGRCVASYESRLKGDYGYGVGVGEDENKARMVAMARCATTAPAFSCHESKVLCSK